MGCSKLITCTAVLFPRNCTVICNKYHEIIIRIVKFSAQFKIIIYIYTLYIIFYKETSAGKSDLWSLLHCIIIPVMKCEFYKNIMQCEGKKLIILCTVTRIRSNRGGVSIIQSILSLGIIKRAVNCCRKCGEIHLYIVLI
jgi:hypothetical protein